MPDDQHQSRPGDASKPEDRNNNDGNEEKPKPRPALWPWLVAGSLVLIFIAVALFEIFAPQPDVWTDDAYVMVHYATIAPRISGQIDRVSVEDNQIVRAGQLLVEIDPRDYQTTVDQAVAQLARDEAQVRDAAANLARQPALIAEQEARVSAQQAQLAFAREDQRRFSNLSATGAGTKQQHQQADANLRTQQANLRQEQAALDAARRQLDVLRAERAAAEQTAQTDRARLDQAKLNLSYTRILAPLDGMIGDRNVQLGNIVSPATPLMSIIPLDRLYVTANYREEALRHVRPGQHVTIHVDAYNIKLDGIVNSIPPASGAIFAPIPPNNATGNFTKIVQRLPVKISIAPNQPLARLLRAGFSVETTIHTNLENVVAEEAKPSAPVIQ